MATVRLPGGPELSYQEWGRPDGSVILLLHGLGEDSDSWRHVAPVLGERFRVIAPDARGHGGSEWTEDYSFELMRDDVVGLMTELGVLAALVMGFSMGAVTAYLLAATEPERVRQLVLEEMAPPDPAVPPRPYPKDPDPEGRTDWRAVIAANRWRNNPGHGWWERAGQITAKTLVIGARDSHLPQDRVAEVAARIPQGEFVAVDGDHNFHHERPSTLLEVVQPFVSWFGK